MKYSVLSQNLKKFRKKANLTQKELGEKIYKSEILIRKYEGGNVNIPLLTLFDISTALDISFLELLGSDYDKYYHDNNLSEETIKNIGINITQRSTKTKHGSLDRLKEILSHSEDYKKNSDSWREAILKIETDPRYLLDSILNYLKNTEKYCSPLFVDIVNDRDDSLSYLSSEQVEDIVDKITDLVKYELYKIENEIK